MESNAIDPDTLWFKIDKEDLRLIQAYKWFNAGRYPIAHVYKKGKRISLYMHKLIINCPEGMEVDHINGDGFDNRKSNLRLATRQQNSYNQKRNTLNSSGYKGVGWYKARNKWRATIYHNNKCKYLGLFETKEEAAKRYNQQAKLLFGEFARLNSV